MKTRTTARLMASAKPRRNTAPSKASRMSVMSTFWSAQPGGAKGLSTRCSVASAADRVMVIRKSVAAKPSSTSTSSLPPHRGSNRWSIEIEPSPRKLSRATRR